jgi:hypothetical protein
LRGGLRGGLEGGLKGPEILILVRVK